MRIFTLAIAALLLLPAGQAMAHAQLVKADPAVGSIVQHPPSRLWLKFNQVIRPAASGVRLTTPDGKRTVLSPLAWDPADTQAVTVPAPPNLMAGRYQVEWRALSTDGHRTQGQFSFTVAH